MARFIIIGVNVAAAFTVYALVDAAMTPVERARALNKPVWIVLIVLLPVIGGIMWLTIGKNRGPLTSQSQLPPDDDPQFSGTRPGMSKEEIDQRMKDLEQRLKELDDEVYPGEEPNDPDQ